jgi:hypothetical protein
MSKPRLVGFGMALLYLASSVSAGYAQKLDASVLYRQDSDVNYFAVIPGYTSAATEGSPDCSLDPFSTECAGTARAGSSIAPGNVTYNVVGTTLSLLLPDGRVAVLNCVNKYSPKGNYINRRSCGMPMVEHVQAEFNGKIAKLKWPVGADGKFETETYKVVVVLDKQLIAQR